jgi:hypothetical protein
MQHQLVQPPLELLQTIAFTIAHALSLGAPATNGILDVLGCPSVSQTVTHVKTPISRTLSDPRYAEVTDKGPTKVPSSQFAPPHGKQSGLKIELATLD